MTLDTFDPMACLGLSDEAAELALVEAYADFASGLAKDRRGALGGETVRLADGSVVTRKHWSQWMAEDEHRGLG